LRTCLMQGWNSPSKQQQWGTPSTALVTALGSIHSLHASDCLTVDSLWPARCNCMRDSMGYACARAGLRWIEQSMPQRVGDHLLLTLRLWHLGPLEPLGGWRTRDTMSSVRPLQMLRSHCCCCCARALPVYTRCWPDCVVAT
jgi:hypothetical protein